MLGKQKIEYDMIVILNLKKKLPMRKYKHTIYTNFFFKIVNPELRRPHQHFYTSAGAAQARGRGGLKQLSVIPSTPEPHLS